MSNDMESKMQDQIEGSIYTYEQLERDALRYRWLRDNTQITNGSPFIARSHAGRISAWTTEYADKAIDEAMLES